MHGRRLSRRRAGAAPPQANTRKRARRPTRRRRGRGRQVHSAERILFNTATAGHCMPRRLSTDHDPVFQSHRRQANLRVLDVEEVKTVPYVPLSHPFIERAIGTIRREYLDCTLFWNSADLQRKLECFQQYYNEARVHRALDGQTPTDVAKLRRATSADLVGFRWTPHCGGLVQLPAAA